jgi:acyl-CoA synthetase (AMP-forming)/AMP-acid ligase II
MFYPPGLDFVIAFFGVLYAGGIAVPLVPPRRHGARPVTAPLLANAQPSLVLTTAALAPRVGELLSEMSSPLRPIATDELAAERNADVDLPVPSPDAVCVLQYTSGSTGTPRGVMVTHENLARNSLLLARQAGLEADSVWVSWVPHFHDLGLFGSICTPLYNGLPSVLMPPAAFITRPVLWLDAIARHRGTTSIVPNFAYDLCVRQIKDEDCSGLDLASWKVAGCGAEPIRMETLTAFADRFGRYGLRRESMCQFYGLAEATLLVSGGPVDRGLIALEASSLCLREHRVASPRADNDRTLISACGQPSPEHRVVIVDAETRMRCAPDTVGEIWIDGSTNAAGYWRQPVETERVFAARLASGEGPFLRTGDLGFLRDGQLYITGRIKDVIIVDGQNIYPQDLEATARAAVAGAPEAAAVALDGAGTQRPALIIEQPKPAPSDPAALLAAVRDAIWRNNGVELARVVLTRRRALPKTSSGKLQHASARAALLDGSVPVLAEWRVDDPAGEPDAAGETLIGLLLELIRQSGPEQLTSLERYLYGIVHEIMGFSADDLARGDSLIAMGASSLGIMRVRRRVEADLMITLESSLLWHESDLKQLAILLREQLLASPLWRNADVVSRVADEINRMSDEDVARELSASSTV